MSGDKEVRRVGDLDFIWVSFGLEEVVGVGVLVHSVKHGELLDTQLRPIPLVQALEAEEYTK